jgi:hypothetical protein
MYGHTKLLTFIFDISLIASSLVNNVVLQPSPWQTDAPKTAPNFKESSVGQDSLIPIAIPAVKASPDPDPSTKFILHHPCHK